MTPAIFSPEWHAERRKTFLTHCLAIEKLIPGSGVGIAEQHEATDPYTLTGLAAKVRGVIAKRETAANA